MATMTLNNIVKKYGDVLAVDDVNLSINDGEFLVLLGPSGCGKSTLLRMIAGLEEISSGDIYVGDRLVNDLPPRDRDMAMVFQSYALYPQMTVFENMAFSMKIAKSPKAEINERVQEVAEMLALDDLLDRRPKQLSGGQRQRVALGRAIVRRPEVFLMDEPLSNLDARLRVLTRAELIKLHQTLAATTVYVTHDQVEAMTMGERIVVMRHGSIQQVDTPRNVYSNPVNMFVASFIGSPSMNFIDGEISKSDDGMLTAELNKYSVKLPSELGALNEIAGRKVVFGLRPEDVHIQSEWESGADSVAISTVVSLVESLGSEAYLYLDAENGLKLVARTLLSGEIRVGDHLDVVFDTDKLHVFDANSEKSLTYDLRNTNVGRQNSEGRPENNQSSAESMTL